MTPVTVLWENEFFLVSDKPSGWLTIPGRTGDADVRPCLWHLLQVQCGSKLWCVHRLDSEVSGLVLFAKSAEAHRIANLWFEDRLIKKSYECLTEKPVAEAFPLKEQQTWKSVLLKGKRRAYEKSFGKECTTLSEFVGDADISGVKRGHWRLSPLTGRPHQLRFEMAKHGFPIWGDTLYGASQPLAVGTIALRAVTLDFSKCPKREDFGLPASLNGPSLTEWVSVK